MWSSIKKLLTLGGGKPDCATKCADPQMCLEKLQMVVDNEADPEKAAEILKQIEDCKMCKDCYEQNSCLKEMLHNKVERKGVPQDLIDCIKSKLKEEGS